MSLFQSIHDVVDDAKKDMNSDASKRVYLLHNGVNSDENELETFVRAKNAQFRNHPVRKKWQMCFLFNPTLSKSRVKAIIQSLQAAWGSSADSPPPKKTRTILIVVGLFIIGIILVYFFPHVCQFLVKVISKAIGSTFLLLATGLLAYLYDAANKVAPFLLLSIVLTRYTNPDAKVCVISHSHGTMVTQAMKDIVGDELFRALKVTFVFTGTPHQRGDSDIDTYLPNAEDPVVDIIPYFRKISDFLLQPVPSPPPPVHPPPDLTNHSFYDEVNRFLNAESE